MIHGHRNAEREEPRSSSRNNPRPARTNPRPIQRAHTTEKTSKRGIGRMATQTLLITIGYTIIRKNTTKSEKNG
jgi:hypothetical protein